MASAVLADGGGLSSEVVLADSGAARAGAEEADAASRALRLSSYNLSRHSTTIFSNSSWGFYSNKNIHIINLSSQTHQTERQRAELTT